MGRSSGPAGTTSAAYTVMPTCGFRSARRKGCPVGRSSQRLPRREDCPVKNVGPGTPRPRVWGARAGRLLPERGIRLGLGLGFGFGIGIGGCVGRQGHEQGTLLFNLISVLKIQSPPVVVTASFEALERSGSVFQARPSGAPFGTPARRIEGGAEQGRHQEVGVRGEQGTLLFNLISVLRIQSAPVVVTASFEALERSGSVFHLRPSASPFGTPARRIASRGCRIFS